MTIVQAPLPPTPPPPAMEGPDGPGVLDALSLVCEVADDLLVKTARDTHFAFSKRVFGITRKTTAGGSTVPEVMHNSIAGAVYGGLGAGLRVASWGLDKVAEREVGPRLDETPRGRFVNSSVNGLIGDKLLEERPQLAIALSVRHAGRDVPLTTDALARSFPDPSGHLVVFLHGLCENESYWNRQRTEIGRTYTETVLEAGATPVYTRANTGLPIRENGAALASLLQDLIEVWPVPVTRISLVGHSLGGLVVRAAGALAADPSTDAEHAPAGQHWTDLVKDVITLGTPHLGAPIAWGIGHGSRGLSLLPETAAFGRILDWRSRGVHDLVAGLAHDVPPIPGARYRLVCATVTEDPQHPVGNLVGDYLVRPRSAYGTDKQGRQLFPDAEVLHLGRAHHFHLLNDPRIHEALAGWLA